MVRATNPQRRNNNPNDRIDQEIQVDDACVIYGGGGNSAAETMVPGNGEYSFAGIKGSCNYCIGCMPKLMDGPAGCEEGFWKNCASSGGGFPIYKRTSYKAPTFECCATGNQTIGDKTCDPKYSNSNSAECGSSMTRLCDPTNDLNKGSVDNLFTNPKCQAFCEQNDTNCKSMYRSACSGDNLNTKRCKDKLMELGGSDTTVSNWCNQGYNMDDPFCSCFKALSAANNQTDSTVRSYLARPECYITQCSSGSGYKTTNMRNGQACPPVQNCINTLNIVGNTDLDVSNINQTCDQNMNSNASNANKSASSDKANPINKILDKIKKTFSSNPNLVYIILFLIILLCGLGLVIFTDTDEEVIIDTNS
jgi:hypothetical protein